MIVLPCLVLVFMSLIVVLCGYCEKDADTVYIGFIGIALSIIVMGIWG